MGSAARFRDPITGENTIAFTKPYWHAFVAHEYVLVDGVPGRWTTESDAKAAAAIAYRAYIGAAEDGSSPAALAGSRPPTGPGANRGGWSATSAACTGPGAAHAVRPRGATRGAQPSRMVVDRAWDPPERLTPYPQVRPYDGGRWRAV